MHIYSFEKLETWQKARLFRREIYMLIFGLVVKLNVLQQVLTIVWPKALLESLLKTRHILLRRLIQAQLRPLTI
jgi:hypothetical protein